MGITRHKKNLSSGYAGLQTHKTRSVHRCYRLIMGESSVIKYISRKKPSLRRASLYIRDDRVRRGCTPADELRYARGNEEGGCAVAELI